MQSALIRLWDTDGSAAVQAGRANSTLPELWSDPHKRKRHSFSSRHWLFSVSLSLISISGSVLYLNLSIPLIWSPVKGASDNNRALPPTPRTRRVLMRYEEFRGLQRLRKKVKNSNALFKNLQGKVLWTASAALLHCTSILILIELLLCLVKTFVLYRLYLWMM